MSEERRVVTVVFVGLVGVDAASAPDPEDAAESAAEVVDAVFTRFRRVIEARGGTVDKFVGDTVMGVFGAPTAHEDDPVRAVRAAIAMKRELELFNAQRGMELRLRVGVNSGEVLWGTVGGDRPTAMGDAVNVAQRLQSEALPGEVLASRAVVRSTSQRIRFGAERSIQVRGRQDPVEVSEALEESTSSAPQDGDVGPAKLVGRGAELDRLTALVMSPSGAFVMIEGESGLGKTRLSSEIRERVLRAAPGTWIGVGHAQEGSPLPLGPFAEIVRAAARAGGGALEEAAATRAFVSEVLAATVAGNAERSNFAHLMTRSMGQAGDSPGGSDAARARAETLEAWERWLRSLARRSPVLLCLEDLHWADPSTFALLDHLGAKLRGERVAIVGTTRPAPRVPGGFERVRLAELPPPEAAALGRELFRRELDPELSKFLVEQSAGNPLYMEELVRFLRNEGLADGDPVRFATRPDRLPDGLRGLLVSRIDAVSAEAREALKCGSVFGRAFWSAATGTLAGHDVAPALEQAGRRQLVERAGASLLPGDEEFHFRQNPLRDAAYSLLTKKERQRLHGRAADLLEPLAPHLGRRVLILAAGHREVAGHAPEAAKLWAKAAQEANNAHSAEEALESARASQRLHFLPEASTSAIRALMTLGLNEQAVAEAEELAALPELGPVDRARARNLLANAVERVGAFARSLAILDEVLAVDAIPPGLRAQALSNRANALFRLSRFEDALAGARASAALAPEIEAIAGRNEALGATGRALVNVARSLNQLGRLDESLAAWEEARRHFQENGDRNSEANALNGIANMHHELGRGEEAKAAYQQALATFLELADRSKSAMAYTNLANVWYETGELAKWRETSDEALRLRLDCGEKWGAAFVWSNRGDQLGRLGKLAEGTAELEKALAGFTETGDRLNAAIALKRIAGLHADAGDTARALEEIDRAIAEYGAISAAPRRKLAALIEKAHILRLAGRAGEALAAAREVALAATGDLAHELALGAWVEAARAAHAAGDDKFAAEAARRALEAGAREKEPDAPSALAEGALQTGSHTAEQVRAVLLSPSSSLRTRLRLLEVESLLRGRAGDSAGAQRVVAEGVALAQACGAGGLQRALLPGK